MAILEDAIETRPCRYGRMSFFKEDTTISRGLRDYGEWAQAEIEYLGRFMGPGDTVLDVGAFIGTHTLAFARELTAGGRIYAFEPQPTFCEVLRKNVEQNGLLNVTIFNSGLSDQPQRLWIRDFGVYHAANFGGATLLESGAVSAPSADHHAVEVMTIDQLSLTRCDFIKIDAEDMELSVLKGGRKTLHTAAPIVFAECNSLQAGWPLVEFMRNEGYDTCLLNVPAYNPCNFRNAANTFLGDARETGLILIPKEKRLAVQDQLHPAGYATVIPITCIDDLALGLLKKPQYKYEVMRGTRAASILGVDFWSNESETNQLRETVKQQKRDLTQRSGQIEALLREQEALLRQREENEQEYGRNLSAHRQEIDALKKEIGAFLDQREEINHEYARNLAAHKEVIRHLEEQCASLERRYADQRDELAWLYRWVPLNKLARRLLFGHNLRSKLQSVFRRRS